MRFVAKGAVAGAASVLLFTVMHHVMISPIWFAFPAMLAAGILCGMALAWSYALLTPAPTIASWVWYNVAWLVLFVALGMTSMFVFEPMTTIGALVQAGGPPKALIARALPMTAAFALAAAAVLSASYRATWRAAGSILVTTVILVAVLGLNISTLGLVRVTGTVLFMLGEVLGLLLALVTVYAVAVLFLEKSRFRRQST